jgi:hypothetical protein
VEWEGGGACDCGGAAIVGGGDGDGDGLVLFAVGVLLVEEEGEKTSLSTAALKSGMSEGSLKLRYALEYLGSLVLLKCINGRGKGEGWCVDQI